jgi:hypothetical protein
VFHPRQSQIAEAWWRREGLYAADGFWTYLQPPGWWTLVALRSRPTFQRPADRRP